MAAKIEIKNNVVKIDGSVVNQVNGAEKVNGLMFRVNGGLLEVSQDVGITWIQVAMTPADILTKLHTVGGSASGLDADLLRGMAPSFTNTVNTIVTRDGTGSTEVVNLTASGNINVSGDVLYDLSDMRMKTEFENIDNVIDEILKIDTVYYYYNNLAKTYGYIKEDRQIGVKAQQIKELFPEAVALAPFDNEDGISRSGENYLTVRYEKLVPVLIEAVKEQQKEIEKLKLLVGDNNG